MDSKLKSELLEGIWKLERYGTYDANKWNEVKAKTSNMFLMLKNMSLMIIYNHTLIEHFSLLEDNVRIVLKDDSLGIVVIKENVKMKKLRVKFSGTNMYSGVSVGRNCVEVLKKYVKIDNISSEGVNFSAEKEGESIPLPQYISQLLSKNMTEFYADNKELTSLYPLEDLVEACILDTDFPSFVAEVHKILTEKLK